ncbi:aconitate hydratase AcnA [Candidatus Ichthyocystis hellenicum]|uniref:aconitate hydratase AcnA n=1 Tax=Candidatus Ichthyocystis hellenicum TaxID=1561003 RepID=UPI000AF8E336|nr:aconitate hydratase AcnA [Candidatus Ichthyocystis hellenicum]
MSHHFSHLLETISVGDRTFQYYSLPALEKSGCDKVSRLPISIRIILESAIRNCDSKKVTTDHVSKLSRWLPREERTEEVPFCVARVVLQDLSGIPLLVDLAGMRTVAESLGKDPKTIEPVVPVDMVVDHSIMIDYSARPDALQLNMEKEFERNKERYQFIKWGMQAFKTFRVVPPGNGIIHQVNLEHLFNGPREKNGIIFPDTLVGTDSHTTMINALGVVGWGVGGIEAEAGMLGQPIYILTPDVIGVNIVGKLREGVTATDLVLTVTQMLRKEKVVGKFIEFFGEGAENLSLADRATIANMAPEYGATMGFFPVDDRSIEYMAQTGRSEESQSLLREYFTAQGIFGMPRLGDIDYTRVLELDLNTIVPSLAGPKRPQDRIELYDIKRKFTEIMTNPTEKDGFNKPQEVVGKSYPTNKEGISLKHGDVLIAAITSCTNTSNPHVLLAAGLLAQKAVEKGLTTPHHVKTSLAPGSRVVAEYLKQSGLQTYLDRLGFNVVAFGCTTCIGNSGDISPEYNKAISEHNLVACSVLSGNRNFEARIHPNIRANFLASPPLVVAFALAGTILVDVDNDPIAVSSSGEKVYLRDIWPTTAEINEVMRYATNPSIYRDTYGFVGKNNSLWEEITTSTGLVYDWPQSTYIANPPFFHDFSMNLPKQKQVKGAKPLLILGDSVTTDHVSPAGSFEPSSPAGEWLQSRGVSQKDFNSYGSRRGHHDVMIRGTFANVRIKNLIIPPREDGSRVEGGYTLLNGNQTTIFEAAKYYQEKDIATIVLAGEEYGTGSSRDWAAKGTLLLGVRAVIAKSYERIHRSNLIGMGVLPLQFMPGESVESLKLTADDTFEILGLDNNISPQEKIKVRVTKPDSSTLTFEVLSRIDTSVEVDYYKHGGILPYVLRELLS